MRALFLVALVACDPPAPTPPPAAEPFAVVAEALLHPRCVNCHPAGDQPLIGDAGKKHGMQVVRGPDGRGIATTMCQNCHQSENLEGEHLPPGAPDWHMPPARTPMVFEGKTAAEICRTITDTSHNGDLTDDELLHHFVEAPLVVWGWSPGEGRVPVPGTHADFAAAARAWIQAGKTCPP